MTMEVYQIQIALAKYKPKIWRRILIQPELLLPDFHLTIQIVMGWENSHLNQFVKNNTFYTERLEDDWDWGAMKNVDYKDLKISDLLKKGKDKIDYEYDFGDSWHHDIILEKILPGDEKLKYPICIDGKLACPPEDCGGIWGYANLLEILKHPDHEEYEEYFEWFGGEFDPNKFDKDEINKTLKKFIKYKRL
jgi:hypothetical protein